MAAVGWTIDATRALVSVWGQERVQSQLDGVARNRSIFERIPRDLLAKGFDKTWQQCRTKMKNLTQKYRKVKDTNRVSGEGRTTCPFFEELDAVLGTRAASSPPVLLESSSHPSVEDQDIDEDSQQLQQLSSRLSDSFPLVTSGSSSLPSSSSLPDGNDEEPEATDGIGSRGREGNCLNENSQAGASGSVDKSSRKRGVKRKQKCDHSVELVSILTKFVEVSEECDAKRRVQEAELENKRREQERNHEERMMKMMMTFMQQNTHSSYLWISFIRIHLTALSHHFPTQLKI